MGSVLYPLPATVMEVADVNKWFYLSMPSAHPAEHMACWTSV